MNTSGRTILLWTLVFAAVLTLLVAGFYAAENARGLHAWRLCQRNLAARGESMAWTNYIPPVVSDAQNVFQATNMAEWFVNNPAGPAGPSLSRLLTNRQITDQITDAVTASNFLAWSEFFRPEFNLMQAGLNRPYAVMPGDFSHPFVRPYPRFDNYRIVVQTLAQRAKCELLLEEPDQALTDLTLLHHLNMLLERDPSPRLLVSSMMHIAISQLYVEAIADGIDSHTWQEAQLVTLQSQLQELKLLPGVAAAFRDERIAICHVLQTQSGMTIMAELEFSKTTNNVAWTFMPRGWVYQNMAVTADFGQLVNDSLDLTNSLILPRKVEAGTESMARELRHLSPGNFIAAYATPHFSKALETTARDQAWVDQAHIACALERYRLANGKYPPDLASLVPRFLSTIPNDIIGGKPIHFVRHDDQNFQLYSVGWNEIDDGGIIAHDSKGNEDRDHGDWVWHYPAY